MNKIYCIDQGGGKSSVTIEENISPTLTRTNDGAPVICLEGNGYRPSHHGDGYIQSNTMYTLNSTEVHGVCYGVDGQNGLVEEEKICTLLGQHSDYKNIPSVMIMEDMK